MPEHDVAVERHARQRLGHGHLGRLAGAGLVAAAQPAAHRERRRLGGAEQLQGVVAVACLAGSGSGGGDPGDAGHRPPQPLRPGAGGRGRRRDRRARSAPRHGRRPARDEVAEERMGHGWAASGTRGGTGGDEPGVVARARRSRPAGRWARRR